VGLQRDYIDPRRRALQARHGERRRFARVVGISVLPWGTASRHACTAPVSGGEMSSRTWVQIRTSLPSAFSTS